MAQHESLLLSAGVLAFDPNHDLKERSSAASHRHWYLASTCIVSSIPLTSSCPDYQRGVRAEQVHADMNREAIPRRSKLVRPCSAQFRCDTTLLSRSRLVHCVQPRRFLAPALTNPGPVCGLKVSSTCVTNQV